MLMSILGAFLLFCLVGALVCILIKAGGIAAIFGIVIIIAFIIAVAMIILKKI